MPTVNSHSYHHDQFLPVCNFVEYEYMYLDYYVGGEGLPLGRPPNEAQWPRKLWVLALLRTEANEK